MTGGISAWERLTSVATLGTSRAPLPVDALWPDPALAQADAAPERTLLRAAAATYIWKLAGQRAAAQPSSGQNESLALADAGSPVSEAAAWRLGRMITGENKELIPQWLAFAQENGRTLPAHWLPVVLDALPPALRNEYSPVLGAAAQWLAQRNPKWSVRSAAQEPSEERWNTGTLEERRAELKTLRAVDPSRARTWVQSTWATDPPEAREEFLGILLAGLSLEDEAFLESALDDKRKGVRLAAAECLARLPSSAHARRNLERLEPLVTLEGQKSGLLGKLRKRKLELQLPESLDKPSLRDGIEAKPPAQRKLGERAFWLMQMIAIVPPAYWTRRFECDAATFIEAALATDYAADLLSALSAAIARHPDHEWLAALNVAWLSSSSDSQVTAQSLAALLLVATPEERVDLVKAQLRELGTRRFDIAFSVLTMIDVRWTPDITQLALNGLSAAIGVDARQGSHARNSLDVWARRCDIETARGAVLRLLENCTESSPWRHALEQMNDIIEFRETMYKELRK